MFALIGKTGFLLHRQRVHIGTKADGAVAVAALQRRNDACRRQTARHFEAPGLQQSGDEFGGLHLG
ncbi:hypothetical protein D9M68_981340 [compost metagenome]